MAQPITKTVPKIPSPDTEWQEVRDMLAQDPETTAELLRLARALHDAGILAFFTGLLEQKDSVMHLAIGELNKPGVKKAVNNLEQLADFLGSIPQDAWQRALQAAGHGLEKMEQSQNDPGQDSLTIFQLLGSLKNPDIARALRSLLAFLEGFGQAMGSH